MDEIKEKVKHHSHLQSAYDKLREKYGDDPDETILYRFYSEERYYFRKEERVKHLDLLTSLKKRAAELGEEVYSFGVEQSSLIAYLFGAVSENPLPLHYYCPKCKKVEYINEKKLPWDMPAKPCACGGEMRADGFDIPFEAYKTTLISPHICTSKKFAEETRRIIDEDIKIYPIDNLDTLQAMKCTLNLRQIKIHDGTKYNEMETLAAIEKQKAIQDAFKEWIWKDEDRRWEVEEAYNNLFGEYETIVYDGSGIEFAGMNPNITLFDYQKNAVQKIISTPNTLLSFDVGAGKTYIMIAAAMEMRKSGLSRKNMFVVPNNIVGQWEKMFTDLYPQAKVLTVEPKSFTPEKRKKVLSQIQKGDYDGIIMAYEKPRTKNSNYSVPCHTRGEGKDRRNVIRTLQADE